MKVVLILAMVADPALAVLLILISGFIFGDGPEGMKGETGAVLVWVMAFAVTLGAPIAGFVLFRHRHPRLGALVAWVPTVGGALFVSLPINPY